MVLRTRPCSLRPRYGDTLFLNLRSSSLTCERRRQQGARKERKPRTNLEGLSRVEDNEVAIRSHRYPPLPLAHLYLIRRLLAQPLGQSPLQALDLPPPALRPHQAQPEPESSDPSPSVHERPDFEVRSTWRVIGDDKVDVSREQSSPESVLVRRRPDRRATLELRRRIRDRR